MRPGSGGAPKRGRQVVVIEDEASISDPLRSALEREGYVVEFAATGADGLEAVRRAEPDIVLLDLGLPDVDGRDVCRAIRASLQVPIIMLTARGQETDRIVGLELGADDYLVKPFSMAELIARMRAVLRRTGERGRAAAASATGSRWATCASTPPRTSSPRPASRSTCPARSSTCCAC